MWPYTVGSDVYCILFYFKISALIFSFISLKLLHRPISIKQTGTVCLWGLAQQKSKKCIRACKLNILFYNRNTSSHWYLTFLGLFSCLVLTNNTHLGINSLYNKGKNQAYFSSNSSLNSPRSFFCKRN